MNARLLSIAAALVLSASSVAAIAQPSQDVQSQASEQTAPAKHHRFFGKLHLPKVQQAPVENLYHGH